MHPSYYECYTLTITLNEPTAQNYEMCLYDVDLPGSSYTCAQPAAPKVCSSSSEPNKIVDNIAGGCGTDEGYSYFLKVFAAGTTKDSCKPYSVTSSWWATARKRPPAPPTRDRRPETVQSQRTWLMPERRVA
jgi:hypothetical protein